MKTYVITLSRVFPAKHKRAGEPTEFEEEFLAGQDMQRVRTFVRHKKLHTIRANYALWAKRFEKIAAGDACLSVREWMGAPYRSKQREIARLTKDDGVGLQQLTCLDTNAYCFYPCVRIENRDIDKVLVATNDGLSLDDWREWFKKYDLTKPLAVIHFTKFRY